jgi:regulation of enolase protein 1 (concanavalin A-like superfamily)
MSIKINGTTVIDDSKNFYLDSVTFSDATSQNTKPAGSAPGLSVAYTEAALLNTIDNPNAYSTSASDQFGSSVAVSGNYAIVSTYLEDDAGGAGSGKVYVYNVVTGQLQYTLNNPNAYGASASDNFGVSVAISGNYAIVGASEDEAGGVDSGKAYIYNVTTGALLYTLDNPNAYSTPATDNFGFSVAISGNYAIVGAYLEDDTGGTTSGRAYIFNVTTGALLYALNNPNGYSTSTALFGYSVAISGNHAIVGAYSEFDASGGGSGKAYIYNVTTGALLYTLDNPNVYSISNGDNFGWSVAISGNYAIVGAYLEDEASGDDSGKAYIYNVTTGALLFTLNNPNAYSTPYQDVFGKAVAISGNYAIVGAVQEDDAGGATSGKAYIFNIATSYNISQVNAMNGLEAVFDENVIITTPGLRYSLANPNAFSTSVSDFFGESVAISGNYAIVGASQEDDAGGASSGKAYIFNVATGALLFTLNNPNAYSTSDSDFFGQSVGVSGNYAIVSGRFEDDSGGASSGKAYVYNVTTGALLYTLNNPNAYSTSATDAFGESVAISGNYAIVGASSEDDAGGTISGKAYIYNVTTGALLFTLNNPNAYSTSASDEFGDVVAIDGNYAIVGARQEDDSGGTDSGKAYIYNVTTGGLLHTLNNPNAYSTSASDSFGIAVAISGNYAIVGATGEDDAGGATSGKAYIFNVTTGALLFTLNNPNAYSTSASDNFGYSVAISGNYAIVGAYTEDDAGGASSGKAYIYNVTTGTLLYTLDNPTAYSTGASDTFGNSVAISGNYAIVSAGGERDTGGFSSGRVYIYNYGRTSLEDRIVSIFN